MMFVLLLLMLVPATAAAGYYFVLTSFGWRTGATQAGVRSRSFAVLIPAHNEASGITRTLDSVQSQLTATDHVTVIADNCSDETAALARQAGANCLERFHESDRGKGYALAWAIPQLPAADVVLILDADCELGPQFFEHLEAKLNSGAKVVQAKVILRNGEQASVRVVVAVGCEIENAVSAGLERLGGTITLRGTGMAFTAEVLQSTPWTSYGLTEDAEYSARLEAAGFRVSFEAAAVVYGEIAPDLAAMTKQRRRWRASLFTSGVGLIHRWLGSKPLVLLQLLTTCLVAFATWLLSPDIWSTLSGLWAALLLILTAVVYLRAIRRAKLGGWRDFTSAPAVVFRLAAITLGGLFARQTTWERTTRLGEATSHPGG
ncbi:MAG: glycosyltransferase family 2 protein [Fimbriiglobus sp.]